MIEMKSSSSERLAGQNINMITRKLSTKCIKSVNLNKSSLANFLNMVKKVNWLKNISLRVIQTNGKILVKS